MSQGLVSFPFLASRAQSQARHRLVSAGPSLASRRPAGRTASTARRPSSPPPQLARSAVRVPHLGLHQTTREAPTGNPHLFVHEGARQQLEKSLRRVLGQRILLAITDNRRTMISAKPVPGGLEIGVHHMFLDADPFTQVALGRYLRYGDAAANATIGSYIESNVQRIRPPSPRHNLITRGLKHDLQSIFGRLNDTYFQGMVDATVSWARAQKRPRRSRASIKLGTYCADRKLIRIHPALDRSWVPRYFVEYVVFHEMLHHMMPMPIRDGRRELHTPEFREGEKRFRQYARAIDWERQHISRLLRS
ncbi:MAG TPA: SprT-like domain-containing protein [Polyangiales bacterium]|nr:SprT-like domain-containing protein [Polyangiales bacterium]